MPTFDRQKRESETSRPFERWLAVGIYALIAAFLLHEMLLKPISSEDAYQQGCGLEGGVINCLSHFHRFGWRIPRIGEVYHFSVIWLFPNYPQVGVAVVFRLINAIAFFALFLLLFRLAVGRWPRLTALDAVVITLPYPILLLSQISRDVVFNGFSNTHNYLPVMVANLTVVYILVTFNDIAARIGRLPAMAFGSIAFFVATAGFDSATVIILALIMGSIFLFRSWSINHSATESLRPLWISAIIGWAGGAYFFFGFGNGIESISRRMEAGVQGSVDPTSSPMDLVEYAIRNVLSHFWLFLPYIIVGVITAYLLHRPASSELNEDNKKLYRTTIICLMFGVLYLLGMAPIANANSRVSSPALILFLVPAMSLAYYLLRRVSPVIWRIAAIASLILVLAMFVDGVTSLTARRHQVATALATIEQQHCVDAQFVNSIDFGTTLSSRLFGFSRYENPFNLMFRPWHVDFFNLDGVQIPIADTCE